MNGTGAVITGSDGDYVSGIIIALGQGGNLFMQVGKPFGMDRFQLDGRVRIYVDDIIGPESQDEKYEVHVVPKDPEIAADEERMIAAAMREATMIAERCGFEVPRWIDVRGGIETLPEKLTGVEGITMWTIDKDSEMAEAWGIQPEEPPKAN